MRHHGTACYRNGSREKLLELPVTWKPLIQRHLHYTSFALMSLTGQDQVHRPRFNLNTSFQAPYQDATKSSTTLNTSSIHLVSSDDLHKACRLIRLLRQYNLMRIPV